MPLGKTNTEPDRCQQHLSDLHFLIAKCVTKGTFHEPELLENVHDALEAFGAWQLNFFKPF